MTADLIREARECTWSSARAGILIEALADALERTVKERDEKTAWANRLFFRACQAEAERDRMRAENERLRELLQAASDLLEEALPGSEIAQMSRDALDRRGRKDRAWGLGQGCGIGAGA